MRSIYETGKIPAINDDVFLFGDRERKARFICVLNDPSLPNDCCKVLTLGGFGTCGDFVLRTCEVFAVEDNPVESEPPPHVRDHELKKALCGTLIKDHPNDALIRGLAQEMMLGSYGALDGMVMIVKALIRERDELLTMATENYWKSAPPIVVRYKPDDSITEESRKQLLANFNSCDNVFSQPFQEPMPNEALLRQLKTWEAELHELRVFKTQALERGMIPSTADGEIRTLLITNARKGKFGNVQIDENHSTLTMLVCILEHLVIAQNQPLMYYHAPEADADDVQIMLAQIRRESHRPCVAIPRGTLEQLTRHTCGFYYGPGSNYCGGCGQAVKDSVCGLGEMVHTEEGQNDRVNIRIPRNPEDEFWKQFRGAADTFERVPRYAEGKYVCTDVTIHAIVVDEPVDGVRPSTVAASARWKPIDEAVGIPKEMFDQGSGPVTDKREVAVKEVPANPPIIPARFVKMPGHGGRLVLKKTEEIKNAEEITYDFGGCKCKSLLHGHDADCPEKQP